ncbi:hypothetical protein HF086_006686 [Spodoptera exigua]|uniref:Uncharacterized protein n=1 Tax=Spodoptera exigua TaxID=7107 RepID=A0A922SSI5_SPOEX|nr:hypothetical protein HF086_006686 [Spodoptera exigua]
MELHDSVHQFLILKVVVSSPGSFGDGVASASPLPRGYPMPQYQPNAGNMNYYNPYPAFPNGFMGGPGYYPQYPGLPYYSPQPRVVYVQAPRSSPPLIRTWDGIHDWAQNTVQSVLGQPAPNTDRNQNTGQPAYNSY